MSKIEKFEGDMFWDDDDPEAPQDPEEYMHEVGCGRVVHFSQALRLADIYGVQYYDAEKDEYESEFFTTKEEAEAFNELQLDAVRRGGKQ